MSAQPNPYDDVPFIGEPPVFLAPQSPAVAAPVSLVGGPVFLGDDWDEEVAPIEPVLMPVAGGRPLLYAGESHMLYGAGGSGKSWLMYLVCAQVAAERGVVLLVDFESNRATVRARLKALGVTREDAGRIAYWKAVGSLLPGAPERTIMDGFVAEHAPSFVGLDSVAKSMAAAGMNESVPGEYVQWQQKVVEPLTARRVTSLVIDHIGHLDATRGGSYTPAARGASSKKDQVSGASYYFEAVEHWTRESDGHGKLTIMKDREGHRKAGTVAALVTVGVADMGARVDITLAAPAAPSEKAALRPTWYMEAISTLLADGGMTANQVGRHFKTLGKSAGYADIALKTLAREGFVEASEPGARGAVTYTLLAAYCQDADADAQDAGGFVRPF